MIDRRIEEIEERDGDGQKRDSERERVEELKVGVCLAVSDLVEVFFIRVGIPPSPLSSMGLARAGLIYA